MVGQMAHPLETQHRPHTELSTRSKLSCISWNNYVRPHLISSDYEGANHPLSPRTHPAPHTHFSNLCTARLDQFSGCARL